MRQLALPLLVGLSVVACSGTTAPTSTAGPGSGVTTPSTGSDFPPAPEVVDGPLDTEVAAAVDTMVATVFTGDLDTEALAVIVDSGDARLGWLVADLLRFFQSGESKDQLVSAFTDLTGAPAVPGEVDFVWAFNDMLTWDLPAWEGFPEVKRALYGSLHEPWETLFESDDAMDWRPVTWGGVLMDERPFGDNGPCNCIPALDDPATTEAAGGSWYPDEGIVFGLVVEGEALALPKNQMEIHEMLNLTLGGRSLGITYCTLCGSAQAYYTDAVAGQERVVLRTSGLLTRSNKVMYDQVTRSVFDTFTGRAMTGPLAEPGVVLEQVTVVGSTWADWKRAHPDTRILAEDGGIGRTYAEDPLRGRDDAGPIFPIGDPDPRLPVQEKVVGAVTEGGTAVAFPVTAATQALEAGETVEFEGLSLRLVDGLRVFGEDGEELTTHQAFWFAWSQFHPDTLLWALE